VDEIEPTSETAPEILPENDGLPIVSPDEEEEDEGCLDNIVPTRGYDMLPVVALGGSAGSITALKEFFDNTPATTGLAYVVVLHLAPGHESTLPALLQRHSAMPVRAAGDEEKIEANTVYVIPPGKHLTATDGHLRLTDLQQDRGRRVAVDLFFRSLADTHGPHAMAVVLSGADGDGAIGLRRIKERGGLTIAQDPEEAEHTGMPRSAIGTGMVDWVLRVAEMPARLMAYHASEGRLRLPPEEGPQPAKAAEPQQPDEVEALLREVLAYLRTRTGCDFSYYKRATIVRRISRRMQVNGVEELGEYLRFLRTHPGEAGALQNDLLISVTNFFRDREAFHVLEEQIPELFKNKGPNDAVRIWTPACATGEETYSLAMLLLEHAKKTESPPMLQVFGCDLNEEAIQTARAGFYPGTIAADVSEERLRRFFVMEPGGFRVRRDLREMVLFATHDLLKDAPFSRMDLVSCRNLLIYLNRDAQKRALEIFHFALKPRGVLFLGSSESIEEGTSLFATVDKKRRIYRQVPGHRVGLPMPTGASALQRTIHHHERLSHAHVALPGAAFTAGLPLSPAQETIPAEGGARVTEIHFKLLGRFGPPSLVVNAHNEIVHLSENANRFLQLPEGEPTRNLLRLAHPMLRVDLRAALLRAEETGEAVDIFRRLVDLPGGSKAVDIRVVPAGEMAPGHLLVIFEAHEPGEPETADAPAPSGTLEPEAVVQQLDRELARANSNLRNTVEQYEATTEELKASNEELQAMNEELRSAGEELETSREELQSVNEELTTVNSELRGRVEELHNANSDLQNLMAATQIATVFLDRALHVMRYTPTAVPLFHFIPGDLGRPITDLRQKLNYPELAADADEVLRTLIPVERDVREDGHWLLARVQPYRTVEDQIAGVVLTFMDITERRMASQALAKSEEKYRTLFDSMDQGYCIIQMLYEGDRPVNWRYLEVNPAFEKHNGLANATGRTIREMAPAIEPKWMEIYGGVAATGESVRFEEDSPTLDGRAFDLYAFRVGEPAERKVAVLFSNITGRKRNEQRQAFLIHLNDALRPLADPGEIKVLAARLLGEHLGVNRAFYADAENGHWLVAKGYVQGVKPLPDIRFPMVDYGQWIIDDFRAGRPLVVRDLRTDERFQPSERAANDALQIIGAASVPLVKDGTLVAMLCLNTASPRDWSRQELALLQETADRTWAAVERAEGAVRENEAWLAGQKEAFQAAVDGEPLSVSLSILSHTAVAQMGAGARCGFYIVDYARGELRHAAGMPEEFTKINDGVKIGPDEPGCGLAVHSGEPVITEDALTSPRWEQSRGLAEQLGFRGVWSVPIETAGEKVIGTMALYFPEPRPATPRDQSFASNMARAAAIIISRSQETEKRYGAEEAVRKSEAQLASDLADMRQLQRISSSLVDEDNLDALYGQILEGACAIMHAETASIQKLIPERNELLLVAQKGFAPESAEYWKWVSAAAASSCGLAMSGEERIIVPDSEKWDLLAGTEDLAHYRLSGIRAMQSTRLVSRSGQLVGMISTHWREVHEPAERELNLFDVLARQVADLIERRTAEEALRHSETRLRTLADAVPQLIWTNSADSAANYFNRRWYDYSGLSFEQSFDLGWEAIVHPDDAPASTERWPRARSSIPSTGCAARMASIAGSSDATCRCATRRGASAAGLARPRTSTISSGPRRRLRQARSSSAVRSRMRPSR
jgi:chemotaxis methyl-accepting protein methylase/GAF domain-containing protein